MSKILNALFGLLLLTAGAAQAQQVYVPLATPRNLLDNGAFLVQQEGTGTKTCATTSAPAVTAVSADRWICDANVTSGAGRAAAVAGGGVKVWRNSGSLAQPITIMQEILSATVTQAAGKAVTLSFSGEALAGLKADNGNVISASIICGTGTNDTYSGGWTASPAITPAWTGISTLQTTNFTITTSAASYQAPAVNVPSTCTEMGVIFSFTPTTTSTGGTTDGFELLTAQLEIGASASPFEVHSIAYDTNVAYTYLAVLTEGAAFKARGSCEIDTTSIALCYLEFPQPMWVAPALTYANGFSALNVATAVACTTLTTAAVPTGNASTPFGVMMDCASSAGFSAASTAAIWGDNAGTRHYRLDGDLMGQNVTITKALVASSANCICLSQAGTSGVSLVINGADAVVGQAGMFGTPPTSAVLDTQRRVLITSGGDDRTVNFTVYGYNDNGAPINCTVAGSNGGTVATPIDFASVYKIVPSGNTASTVTVGTNSIGSTPWILANRHVTPTMIGLALEFPSGSVTASAEYTLDPITAPIPSPVAGGAPAAAYAPASPNPNVNIVTGLSAASAYADAVVNDTIYAWRLTVTSGTGTAQLSGQQAGIAQG